MARNTALLCALLLLSGCALKQYPSSPPVSNVQATTLDCQGIEDQLAKQEQVQAEINKTGEFNGLTVLGFIGDFGIGNGVAKSLAQKHASQRLAQLKGLQQQKC
ncbi:hypothetical protein [Erwinia sp. ErVv1]|uniref:hypothetical protein n=1 Tax=Erwinia sp. ErVv1 TaxID=1603299 RepID=UPI000836145F|nr:hypothetical protein [Erwinia sp. ErVv1]